MYHQIGGDCSPDSALVNGGSECYEPIPQVVSNISGAISVQSGYVSEISHPYLFFVFFWALYSLNKCMWNGRSIAIMRHYKLIHVSSAGI